MVRLSSCYSRKFFSHNSGQGLSLVELLTTIVIISIIGSSALPLFEVINIRDREGDLKEALIETRTGIDRFYADNGHYPHTFDDLRWYWKTNKPYLRKSPPINPFAGSNRAWIVVIRSPEDRNRPWICDNCYRTACSCGASNQEGAFSCRGCGEQLPGVNDAGTDTCKRCNRPALIWICPHCAADDSISEPPAYPYGTKRCTVCRRRIDRITYQAYMAYVSKLDWLYIYDIKYPPVDDPEYRDYVGTNKPTYASDFPDMNDPTRGYYEQQLSLFQYSVEYQGHMVTPSRTEAGVLHPIQRDPAGWYFNW